MSKAEFFSLRLLVSILNRMLGFSSTESDRKDQFLISDVILFLESEGIKSHAAILGSITSKRKAAASRRNGKRGGRPRNSSTAQKGEK